MRRNTLPATLLSHTLKEVKASSTNCTNIERNLRSSDPVQKRALDDCLELLDDTIAELNDVVFDLSSRKSASKHFHDLQTLLSGAMTNQYTCVDGFDFAKGKYVRSNIQERLLTISNHVSNILVMVNKIKSEHKATNRPTSSEVFPEYGRVKNGFPTWVSSKDRRMLQSTVNATKFDLVVAKDGTGNFTTIGEAVAAAPNNSETRFVIYIKAGAYLENVEVVRKKTNLMFVGDGIGKTVVKASRNHVDGWTTFRSATVGESQYERNGDREDGVRSAHRLPVSKLEWEVMSPLELLSAQAPCKSVVIEEIRKMGSLAMYIFLTLAVVGNGFIAKGITFENSAGPSKHQAVALRSGSDLSTFYKCSFIGYQDTLYAHSLRQFYRECDVYGTIDFIFGNAAVVLQNCNFYARRPNPNQHNIFTAQGREDPNQNTGISILNCKVTAASDLSPVKSSFKTYLGRPWKEYSRTVFMKSYIDDLVDPAGWLEWNATFALTTLYYGEYMNHGPGSNTSARVTWPGYRVINSSVEASRFSVDAFIQGGEWLNSTQVPYFANLG
ncbi:putative pectinesterase/pectinesterase inhibitor 39 [Morus notabilis]|uniref:Pectinesterase n=1 Tax=Morus notabilis TaxID=981085 RepID=W9QFI6_9ROSA|nr:putative pectinesterase/pectinesterase inhibitor 39 [Morus notabilis]